MKTRFLSPAAVLLLLAPALRACDPPPNPFIARQCAVWQARALVGLATSRGCAYVARASAGFATGSTLVVELGDKQPTDTHPFCVRATYPPLNPAVRAPYVELLCTNGIRITPTRFSGVAPILSPG